MCIFYEKINIQEKMKLNGELEIHVLEEKIRFLKLKIAEKQRQIHVTQQLLPVKRSLDADLAVLQIQVGKAFMLFFLGSFDAFSFFSPLLVCRLNKFLHVNQARLLLVPLKIHELNALRKNPCEPCSRRESVLQASELQVVFVSSGSTFCLSRNLDPPKSQL